MTILAGDSDGAQHAAAGSPLAVRDEFEARKRALAVMTYDDLRDPASVSR